MKTKERFIAGICQLLNLDERMLIAETIILIVVQQ